MQQESDNNQRKAAEKQHEIKETRKKPYFARIDCGPYRDDLHTAYLGNSKIGQLVIDWRNSSVGNAYYYSDMLKNSKGVCLALKRVFTFVQENLSEFSDEINTYGYSEGIAEGDESSSVTDSLFLSLLKLSRDNQTVHDIVSTIQQNQYDIITSDFSQNALINGCAGSGKTMILYHRLSYIAYNDPSNFFPQYVFAVTPSALFVSLCNDLIDQLHLNEIHNMTYEKTLRYICEQYYASNGVTRYIDNKNHTEESSLGTEGLSEREYLAFKKIVSSVSMNPADFTEWFVEKINKILRSKGLEELDELEVYKRIALKKDLSVLVDNQIRKEPFTLSTSRKKRELDKRTGTHVEIDETVVTNRPRELTDYSWENFEYTFRSNPSRWKLICKYSSELNQLLSDKPQMDDKGKKPSCFKNGNTNQAR